MNLWKSLVFRRLFHSNSNQFLKTTFQLKISTNIYLLSCVNIICQLLKINKIQYAFKILIKHKIQIQRLSTYHLINRTQNFNVPAMTKTNKLLINFLLYLHAKIRDKSLIRFSSI